MRVTDKYNVKADKNKKIEDDYQEILNFHWDPKQLKAPLPMIKKPDTVDEKYKKISQEKSLDRINRQILNLHNFVINCSMCHLGTNSCNFKDTVFDPHVFSNMNPSKWVIVGQNPGYNECLQGKPFVGDSGKVFDNEIAKHGISRDKFYITNTVKCLRYNSRVLLADGTYKPISHLVREKYSGLVRCVINGKLINRKVIGWYKSNLVDKNMYKLSFEHGKTNHSGRHNCILTSDHKVLTTRGYISVSDLLSSDFISTGTPKPSSLTEEIIIGMLLGDGTIYRSSISTSHSIKQRTYVKLLYNALKSLGCSYDEYLAGDGTGKKHHSCRISTNSHPYFKKVRSVWYRRYISGVSRPQKIIPNNLIISPLSLAIWYMDDGYLYNVRKNVPKCGICCQAFSKNAVDKLRNILYKSYGIRTVRRWRCGWYIWFNTENAARLFEVIAKFIIPSLRYKIPDKYHEISFERNVFSNRKCEVFFDKHIKIKIKILDKSVYCIDVKDAHNFITPGGVVHNCYTTGNAKPLAESQDRCEAILRLELTIIKPIIVITLGAVSFNAFCPSLNFSDSMGKISVSEKFGVKVFPIYHPSPRNTNLPDRREQFEKSIKLLCSIITAYDNRQKGKQK